MRAIERASQEIAAKRDVSIQTELLNADAPADCAAGRGRGAFARLRKALAERSSA